MRELWTFIFFMQFEYACILIWTLMHSGIVFCSRQEGHRPSMSKGALLYGRNSLSYELTFFLVYHYGIFVF